MASDINRVVLVGRLTRDSELKYTSGGMAIADMSLACNTSRKQGDNWVDYGNFFDVALFGRRAEALQQYLTKGTQIAIEGQLRQDRWEQDGSNRSKVSIIATDVQLLGGKRDGQQGQTGGSYQQGQPQGSGYTPEPQSPGMGRGDSRQQVHGRPQGSRPAPQQGGHADRFEDDIPF